MRRCLILSTGHSALFDYIRAGDALGAKSFLERLSKHGKNAVNLVINARDEQQFTPSMACVAELSRAKTEKNKMKTSQKKGKQTGRTEILKLLISKGANLKATDDWGRSIAHLAAANSDVQAIIMISEKAPDTFEALDSDGFSAADYSHSDDLDKILRLGVEADCGEKRVLLDKLRSRFNPPLSKLQDAATLSDPPSPQSPRSLVDLHEMDEEEELDRLTPSAAAEQAVECLAKGLSVEMAKKVNEGLELSEMAKKQLRSINACFVKKGKGRISEDLDDTAGTISADGLFEDRRFGEAPEDDNGGFEGGHKDAPICPPKNDRRKDHP